MRTVVSVMLLILARVGFPSQVHFIDSLDKQIGLVGWHVLQVGVVPSMGLPESSTEQDILFIWRSMAVLGFKLILDKCHLFC